MRWDDFRRSSNVEDGTGRGGSSFGGPVRLGGGAIIVAVVASLLFGINPLDMLGAMSGVDVAPPPASAPAPGYGPAPQTTEDPAKDFVRAVLGSTEDVWGEVFTAMGARYVPPKLRLFTGVVQSACGQASAASGPFYCSADQRVYLDTAFFAELKSRFHAPGDFASGYVIAHEVGHHVQYLLGVMNKFNAQAERADARGRNALSVQLELQADCFAGIWGHHVETWQKLDAGDIEEGLRAAAAVGDDQIQKRTRGYVVPESFTHGSAEQRVRWFRAGFSSGDVRQCNTFSSRAP